MPISGKPEIGARLAMTPNGRNAMKIWGRTTSSNVQKVMWGIGEMGLAH